MQISEEDKWAQKEFGTKDEINPEHYKTSEGIQAIDVIEFFNLGLHLGNAAKYILRAGKKTKDPEIDLRKAHWYINRFCEGKFRRGYMDRKKMTEQWEFFEKVCRAFKLDDKLRLVMLQLVHPNNYKAPGVALTLLHGYIEELNKNS